MHFRVDPLRPHLGGDIVGGDPRSWCPEVWKVLSDGPYVLDVGCGEGQAMKWFVDNGYKAEGVDGIERNDLRIYTHDFTRGPFVTNSEYDLIWSCEFLEHVEERYLINILPLFKKTQRLAVTAAPPGQSGYHHVNCQYPEYWIKLFEDNGFEYNVDLTTHTKNLALPQTWWRKNGMIFDRC